MSTSFQRQVELRILHHMHVRLHFGSRAITKEEMFEYFCKKTNISRDRFEDAFSSLSNHGYFVENSLDGKPALRLSSFGVDWIEDYYTFTQEDSNKQSLTYYARYNGTIMIGMRRQAYLNKLAAESAGNKVAVDIESSAHWTRSGAIAGWVAVAVAILAILVAIVVAN